MSMRKSKNYDEELDTLLSGTTGATASVNVPVRMVSKVNNLLSQLLLSDEKKDEDEQEQGNQWDVKKVCGHAQDGNEFSFQLEFSDGSRELIDDEDCNCEELIRKYLTKTSVGRTVYCICRVSSKNQTGPRHVSLAAQKALLEKTAQREYGKNIRVKFIQISASAYKGVPKAFQQVAENARAGDAILVYRVDRLSRNIFKILALVEDLRTRGVSIYARDENVWYDREEEERLRFVQGILDAHKEARIIGNRVKASIELRKARGDESLGSLPYGERTVVEKATGRRVIAEHPQEQAIIKRIMQSRMSPQEMADQLNSEKLYKRGRRWNAKMIKAMDF